MPLRRPEGVANRHWDAIETQEARLARASSHSDRSAVLGAAKELCECVASVVCASLAQTISTGDDFGTLINAAHTALDRRPGRGATAERSVRNIAQAARTIATEVNTLRNDVGTGHGRPLVPVVTSEFATIGESAALLWCGWALARLDVMLRSQVAGLLAQLDGGGHWRRGLLAQRFQEVDLPSLHSEDQRRIGVAVAHRASIGGTFVVSEAGVEPLIREAEAWPSSYRSGVAAGLLLDDAGRLSLRARYVEALLAVVALMDVDEWSDLSRQATKASMSSDLARDVDRQRQVADLLDSAMGSLGERHRQGWALLAERLRESADGSVP